MAGDCPRPEHAASTSRPRSMAMEGHFESQPHGAPLILFGLARSGRAQIVRYAMRDPEAVVSLILKHDLERAARRASTTVPREDRPPVPIVFWSFRVMVTIGMLMLALGLVGAVAALARPAVRRRAGCIARRSAMGPAGFVAVLAGWITTEIGRQPFTVFGLLRTADAVSPVRGAGGRHHR
ncbi:MAG: cytochrome ubiquinol oxidase subunit I [Rhodopseudomonas palustris]|nr:cytochrome ubiquinol oxidase subunit I [Rhodopseudomonas palustris]